MNRVNARLLGAAVGLMGLIVPGMSSAIWSVEGTQIAPPAFETNNNSTSALSYGAWVATGSAKLRLSLDPEHDDYLDTDEPELDWVGVYETGAVTTSDCIVRRHHGDGSGESFPFDTTNVHTGFNIVARDGNINYYPAEFLEVECQLYDGDAVNGAWVAIGKHGSPPS
jgi:hypothetical protein